MSAMRKSASTPRMVMEPRASTATTDDGFIVPLPLPSPEVIEPTQRIALPIFEDGGRLQGIHVVKGPPTHVAARMELRSLERNKTHWRRPQAQPVGGGAGLELQAA